MLIETKWLVLEINFLNGSEQTGTPPSTADCPNILHRAGSGSLKHLFLHSKFPRQDLRKPVRRWQHRPVLGWAMRGSPAHAQTLQLQPRGWQSWFIKWSIVCRTPACLPAGYAGRSARHCSFLGSVHTDLSHFTPDVFGFMWEVGTGLPEAGMESAFTFILQRCFCVGGGSVLCSPHATPKATLHPTHRYKSKGNSPC